MNSTKHVAVLIETSLACERGLLSGVCRFHQEHETWSIYFKPRDLGDSLPQWLSSWHGDGILARVTNQKIARALIATSIPFIDLRGGSKDLGIPMFGPNNQQVSVMAFEHLHERGLRHFAFCGESTGGSVFDDERKCTFQQVVQEHEYDCHVFKAQGRKQDANDWEVEQQQLIEWLGSLPKPVGIMACHDDRGQKILDACRRGSLLVPDEIAVIGVGNDVYFSGLSIPSLSSVDINSQSIGYEAASLLDRMMRGKKEFDQDMLFKPVGVVVRQSTDVVACTDQEIAAAIRFIAQHACHRMTVEDLAQHVALSRTLLNRRFKQIVGRTPKAEIVRVQLEHAKRLLLNTDLSVSTVGDRAGFSESNFIVVFRRSVGQTPRAFRARHGRLFGLGWEKGE